MTYALVGLCVVLAAILAPALVWVHAEVSEGKRLRDRLDAELAAAGEYQHLRDVAVAELEVTKTRLATEQQLRAAAEAQRNAAEQKARTYLTQNLAHASEEEINATVRDIFSAPLSLAPDSALMRPGD